MYPGFVNRHGRDLRYFGMHHIRAKAPPPASSPAHLSPPSPRNPPKRLLPIKAPPKPIKPPHKQVITHPQPHLAKHITDKDVIDFEQDLLKDGWDSTEVEEVARIFANFISKGPDPLSIHMAGVRSMLYAWDKHGQGTTLNRDPYFWLARRTFRGFNKKDPWFGLTTNIPISIHNFQSPCFSEVVLYSCGQGTDRRSYFTEGGIPLINCEVVQNLDAAGQPMPFTPTFKGAREPEFWVVY